MIEGIGYVFAAWAIVTFILVVAAIWDEHYGTPDYQTKEKEFWHWVNK